MNKIFGFGILLLAMPLLAKEGFYCIPSMKSTWIYVEKKSDVVTVVVKNPMGYDQMPQFDGPLSQPQYLFKKCSSKI